MPADSDKKQLLIDRLQKELGFWPENENALIKNLPTLAVLYLLVQFDDEKSVSIFLRNEKTLIGDIKSYDSLIKTLPLSQNNLFEQIQDLLNSDQFE